jgi:hypothetical protein
MLQRIQPWVLRLRDVVPQLGDVHDCEPEHISPPEHDGYKRPRLRMGAPPAVLLPANGAHVVGEGLKQARRALVLPQSAGELQQLHKGVGVIDSVRVIDSDMLALLPGEYNGFE